MAGQTRKPLHVHKAGGRGLSGGSGHSCEVTPPALHTYSSSPGSGACRVPVAARESLVYSCRAWGSNPQAAFAAADFKSAAFTISPPRLMSSIYAALLLCWGGQMTTDHVFSARSQAPRQ